MGMALRLVVCAERAALGQECPILHGASLPSQHFVFSQKVQ